MTVEKWIPIAECDGLYEISNFGNVRKKGRLLKGQINNGYKEIMITYKGVRKKYKIHRLVAKAFLSNPNNYPVVNHKDENKSNNRVENLEWCTQKHNSNYGTCIQRRSKNHEKSVVQMQDGKTIKKWESVIKAGSNLLIDPSSIIKVAKGKRKTAGGFEWIYDS